MSDNSIGLHIYSLKIRRKRKFEVIPLGENGEGATLSKAVPVLLKRFKSPLDEETGRPRSWYFEDVRKDGFTSSGTIRYGSSGYESEIVDGKTRSVRYKRSVTDLDVIPIYFRVWVPDDGEYGLLALQTFGQRSCVNRVQQALQDCFRAVTEDHMLDMNPVHPASMKSYMEGDVKTISLVKREYSTDSAENAVVDPNEIVDLDVSFKAKPRSSLGKLSQVMKRIRKGDSDQQELKYNDTYFDEASANVVVGGKTRKVVIVGLSKNAGKIDLSEDVLRMPNGHPKYVSIDHEVEQLFVDIVAG